MLPPTRSTVTRLQRLGYTATDDGGRHVRLTHPSGHVLHVGHAATPAALHEVLRRAVVALAAGPYATSEDRRRVRRDAVATEARLRRTAAMMRAVPAGATGPV